MSGLYKLFSSDSGYQFTNQAGDQYNIYLTTYSLLNPFKRTKEDYIDVYMLGFNCKRADAHQRQRYDVKSKATIIAVFKSFMEQYPDEAFVYVCANNDGFARNRRIIFGRWFLEFNGGYERFQSHITYNNDNWYSALLVRTDNANKQLYIDAYNFTLQQMLSP